ncbi:MAG: hypothetical protein E7298_00650 [Lachnospiraceae bacterium]|jgi:hypothetical protein|nr:hypothetical protein [Lachnospiraceae bacterium]
MDELIRKIEETIYCLLKYDMDKYPIVVQELVNMMVAVFPAIINIYSNPKMSDLRDDASYWPGQLERVVEAINGGDHFEVVDVLYSETRANLIELREVLTRRDLL